MVIYVNEEGAAMQGYYVDKRMQDAAIIFTGLRNDQTGMCLF
jgi:hypothetical protein